MTVPTDGNVDFILCDAVRGTPDGKFDIAGYFPVHEVKLDGSVPLPVAINLTFVFILKDGDGQFGGTFRILDPLDAELHRQALDEFTKQPEMPHLISLGVSRIPIVRSGNFTVLLEIGGQEYRRPVRIFQ